MKLQTVVRRSLLLLGCAVLLTRLWPSAAAQDAAATAAPRYANPTRIAFDDAGREMVVYRAGDQQASTIDVESGRILRTVPAVDRLSFRFELPARPVAAAGVPGQQRLVVACDPPGREGRVLCVVDLATEKVTRRVIPGSSNLRGVAVDPQGKFALATHLIPKSQLPSTQIEQGWVFTNAVSYVPLAESEPVVTVPLDLRTQGFANPEGVAIAPDGKRAYITHAGADVVSVIDLPALLQVAASTSETAGTGQLPTYPGSDLRMTRRYVVARVPVEAAPGGIAVSPDGQRIAVANRLADSVSLIDAHTLRVIRTVRLSETPVTAARQGEILFQAGRLSWSGQFSCVSCHPDGHSDGLNWDLPADGFNNFQNTKSLLGIAGTAPYGWQGSSATLRDRFTGTLRHLFQFEPTEAEAAALDAYLQQLPLPEVAGPDRLDAAQVERGAKLFRGRAGCAECHSGARLTDGAQHDIGTGERPGIAYDTPSLLRVAGTAPYLHDGRAATLADIFTQHNPQRLHGNAAELSAEELADLIAYLNSL